MKAFPSESVIFRVYGQSIPKWHPQTWLGDSERACVVLSLSLSYSNDVNCLLQEQEMCPLKEYGLLICPVVRYGNGKASGKQRIKKGAEFKSAKAEFDPLITTGFLTYIYDLTAEIIT